MLAGIDPSASGEVFQDLLKLPGEKQFVMRGGSHIPVPVGASAIVRTGGGGGWGDPFDRPADAVANDVAEGLITTAAARKLYGVAVRGDMSLDEKATQKLRTRVGSARKAESVKKRPAKKKPSTGRLR